MRRFEIRNPTEYCRELVLSCLILLFILIIGQWTNLFAQERVTRLVDQAILLFNDGKFKEAELTALRALQDTDSLTAVDRAELHRILGFSYVAQEENEKAKRQFLLWLELDPLASLDPIYISPKIIAVFNQAKEEFVQQQLQTTPADQADLKLRVVAFQKSLLFPGRGQIYQGEKIKGISLITAEILMLGAFTYSHLQYERTHARYLDETNPAKIDKLYNESNLYYRGRMISASLSAGIYLYSLFDAAYSSPPQQEGAQRLSLQFSPDPSHLLTLRFQLIRR